MKQLLPQNLSIYTFSVFALLLFSCGGKNDKGTNEKPINTTIAADVVVAGYNMLERKINSTGTIMANEEVELRSEASGKITGIYFSEGSKVNKGTLLVKINDSDLQAQLKKLILQDTLLSRDEFRKRKLLEINAISKEEYDNAYTQLQSIRAEKNYIAAQIEKTEIKAPFDGYVGLRNVSEGAYVNNTFLIAALQQVNPVKLEFSVPEKYKSYLRKGTVIQFSISGNNKLYNGTVYAVESKIDAITRTIKVRATCANENLEMVPGAFAKIELILEKVSNALLIPAEAVIPEMNGQKVFVIKNGKATGVKVNIGSRTDTSVEITTGIQPGDTIAVTGILQLRDGVAVKATVK